MYWNGLNLDVFENETVKIKEFFEPFNNPDVLDIDTQFHLDPFTAAEDETVKSSYLIAGKKN